MTRKEHIQLWHKKQGKEAGVNALAKHGTIEGARPVKDQVKLTPAQVFFKNLKTQIKNAV